MASTAIGTIPDAANPQQEKSFLATPKTKKRERIANHD
jgi:hypothetical protein